MTKEDAIAAIEARFSDDGQQFILATLTDDGYPDARIMGNICEKTMQEVYFTCRAGTRKIGELIKNPKSSVYFTKDGQTFWLYGEASVTKDESVRRHIWNDRMLPIYSEGPDSPLLTVIRFIPKKVRCLSRTDGYTEFSL